MVDAEQICNYLHPIAVQVPPAAIVVSRRDLPSGPRNPHRGSCQRRHPPLRHLRPQPMAAAAAVAAATSGHSRAWALASMAGPRGSCPPSPPALPGRQTALLKNPPRFLPLLPPPGWRRRPPRRGINWHSYSRASSRGKVVGLRATC